MHVCNCKQIETILRQRKNKKKGDYILKTIPNLFKVWKVKAIPITDGFNIGNISDEINVTGEYEL
jgi:hypothetical protein